MNGNLFTAWPKAAWNFWFGPAAGGRLRLFEKAFVLSYLCYFFLARYRWWREWLTPEGFHYSAGHTPSHLIEPFPLLPARGALLFGAGVALCGALLVAGKPRRPALLGLLASAVYIQNADALSSFALNIHYVVGFAVLLAAPWAGRGAEGRDGRLLRSAWPLRTLQATFLLQLFTAGWCKVMVGDWVQHGDVLWSHLQGPYRNHLSSWLLHHLPARGWTVMQWGALLFELCAPWLLLARPTRWVGILWALGFAGFIAATMSDLQYFAFQLATYLLLFLPPEWSLGVFRGRRDGGAGGRGDLPGGGRAFRRSGT